MGKPGLEGLLLLQGRATGCLRIGPAWSWLREIQPDMAADPLHDRRREPRWSDMLAPRDGAPTLT